MKKLLLFAALAGTTAVSAQRAVGDVQPLGPAMQFNNEQRTPTDTLIPPSFLEPGAEFALYTADVGGYVVGSNAYGDLAKVQVFTSTGNVMVEELLFFFGGREGDGTVHARVYSLDGPGMAEAGAVNNAPNIILGSVDLAVSDADTSGALTTVSFSPPVEVDGDFGAGLDFSDLAAGVYIGLATTPDGAAGAQPDMNWELWDDGTWNTLTYAWPLTFDFAVFAVIDDGTAGIHDQGTLNNMRMSLLGGNPATHQVTVAYEMLERADTRLVVMDSKGAIVHNEQLGQLGAGVYQNELNVSSFPNGTYYVTLYANDMPLTKRLVVSH